MIFQHNLSDGLELLAHYGKTSCCGEEGSGERLDYDLWVDMGAVVDVVDAVV